MDQNRKNLLIVDDDATIRKLISFHLKNNDYNVFEADSAEEAFVVLRTKRVNLVLCDVSMEDMDGFTFCKKVREDVELKVLPFIFVTAKDSIEDKTLAHEAGGDDIITKPFDVNELLLKIQALLRRSEIFKTYGTKKTLENNYIDNSTSSKILLVDDDPTITKLFQFNLNKEGFTCISASSVEEGFKKAKEFLPDIIISDIMMPFVDGFTFRRMLLDDPDLRTIPFIFFTARGQENDILDGYELGIHDYVIKTSGPKVVVAKVKAIIKSLDKERHKIVSELNQAADSLRVKVVPDKDPEFKGYSIKHWYQPYKGVPGGDFIDYFSFDENNIAVILGDVMGKKWGAWYFAFAYAGYIRSALRLVIEHNRDLDSKHILQQVNASIYKDAKLSEIFTTLSLVIINNRTNELKYSGAGDLPLLLIRNNSRKVVSVKSKGLLLGFDEVGHYDSTTIKLESGDQLFLLTDGIIESRNKDGEQFGEAELNETLINFNGKNTIEVIKEKLSRFTDNNFEDDISLISIKKD
ncbi:MAG: response regulator [Syntrophothermus sp.]